MRTEIQKNKCGICGFDKKTEIHHIIKRADFGSDEEENLICLCPNHHWVADFGTDEDRKELVSRFKKLGLNGIKKSQEFIDRIDKMIFVGEEDGSGYYESEKEKEDFRTTSNYNSIKRILLNKNHPWHIQVTKKLEIKLLIKLLNEELEKH